MFFNAVSNGEGTSYVPTALGSALMAVVFCALLGGALYLIAKAAVSYRKKSEGGLPAPGRLTPKKLAFCAVAVALGVVLSNVKLFHFPTGGSITLLSMLVVCLPGYWTHHRTLLRPAAACHQPLRGAPGTAGNRVFPGIWLPGPVWNLFP